MRRFIKIFFTVTLLAIQANAATPSLNLSRTRQKALECLSICKKKGFNTRYCILVDMSLPSGLNRFVIWDFKRKRIHLNSLVSHGCSRNPWAGTNSKDLPTFSNANGSHATSLGKYLIGKRDYSAWGIHIKYFLKGLEPTNNNAMKRVIVLHSWDSVANAEVYPNGTPEGWGCPAISNAAMKQADALLKHQRKPMMLWIYN